MIELHVGTCALTLGIACLAIGLAFLGLRAARDGDSAGSNWSLAAICQGVAWILIGLRGQIPDWASVFVSSLLLLASAILLYRGAEGFSGARRRVHWLVWCAVLAALALPFAWMTFAHSDIRTRIALQSLLRVALILPAAWLLWSRAGLRGRAILAALFGVDGAWHLVRAVATIYGEGAIEDLLLSGPWQANTFLLRGASMIAIIAIQFRAESANNRVALRAWAEQLEQESRQLEDTVAQRNAELRHLASVDFLTGMANRREFLARAEQEIARARRHGTPLALLMLDIDRFKSINDGFGHPVGDQAIVAVARHCMNACRESDLAGRLGGEEFGLLLPYTGAQEAQLVAERLRQGAHTLPLRHGRLTVSVGVACLAEGDGGPEALMLRADRALYGAKNEGRDCVRCA